MRSIACIVDSNMMLNLKVGNIVICMTECMTAMGSSIALLVNNSNSGMHNKLEDSLGLGCKQFADKN